MHVPATVTLRALEDVDGLADELSAVASMLDVDSALRAAATAVRSRTGIGVSFLGTTSPGTTAESCAAIHIRQVEGNITDSLHCLEIPTGTGLGGQVLADGRIHWVENYLDNDTITHEHDAAVQAELLQAIVAVPITRAGTLLGVLYGAQRVAGPISDVMCDALGDIADQTGLLLDAAERTRTVVEQAVASERRRLAGDLHDSVGAMLFAIGASATELVAELADMPEVSARAQALVERASAARVALRRSLRALHRTPASLALGTALTDETEALSARSGIDARLLVLSDLPEVAPSVVAVVAAAVREALHNTEKHAGAGSVVVTTMQSRGGVAIAVADDGQGLGVAHRSLRGPVGQNARPKLSGGQSQQEPPTGLGLEQTAIRLARVGGELSMHNNDEGGMTIRIWVPA